MFLIGMDVCFPKIDLQMLSYQIFEMQYDLPYNHINYLSGMIKLKKKHIKLINRSKTSEEKKEETMESKLEANQKQSWKQHQTQNWKQTQKQT